MKNKLILVVLCLLLASQFICISRPASRRGAEGRALVAEAEVLEDLAGLEDLALMDSGSVGMADMYSDSTGMADMYSDSASTVSVSSEAYMDSGSVGMTDMYSGSASRYSRP